MGEILQFPSKPRGQEVDPQWGLCPTCHSYDGYLNAEDELGMGHWFWCKEHRLKWHVGTNLFSTWEHMTGKDLHRQHHALAKCEEVKPWYPTES